MKSRSLRSVGDSPQALISTNDAVKMAFIAVFMS
jgi:hypothetical protein